MIAERVIEICRYDPDKDVLPYMRHLEVDIDQNDRMVPDVLVRLKSVDESISLRRSCREGARGSCAININLAKRPACQTSMNELPSRIILRLLPGLPVIRDLIVDMMSLFQRYPSVMLYLINDTPRRRGASACRARRSALSWMACANAVRRRVRNSGGILTSMSVPPGCCRRSGSSSTPATWPPAPGSIIWKTRTACFVAALF